MNLQASYQKKLDTGLLKPDAAQQQCIEYLDDFSNRMHLHFQASFIDRISRRHPHTGHIYMWGQVGRGKTMLMDMLFQNAQVTKKRVHFGTFMRWLHSRLNELSGNKNPLVTIAEQAAHDTQLLCFDEFQVIDIGDAMLIGTFLDSLFKQSTVVCMTSNLPPAELYKDGLQRSRFLPAIRLLEQQCDVVALNAQHDYRQLHIEHTEYYLQPINDSNRKLFTTHFNILSHGEQVTVKNIDINGREVQVQGVTKDAVWFDFSVLCRQARSSADYIHIATTWPAVFLSNIEGISDPEDSDAVRRFINLIDQLYDHGTLLSCLADVDIDKIYTGSLLAHPFERCHSRLVEMRSKEYVQKVIK